MKTKDYEARATQDITIGELPKQDNPNNSDLLVIQGSSLTEATTIQQLRGKILYGGVGSGGDTIGVYRFSATLIEDSSWGLMDGTQYSKEEKEDFYNWLLQQDTTTKQAFSLDIIAEKFILPNYSGLGLKVTNSTGLKNTVGGVVTHKHILKLADGEESTPPAVIGVSNNYYIASRNGGIGGNTRAVVTLFYEGDSGTSDFGNISKIEATPNPNNISNQNLPDVPYPYFTGFCYIKMTNGVVVDTVNSPFIKSDGSVAMNIDYTPTDIQDVATKRYIDNKFLNYEVPLSFSINELGKRVSYYKGIETNPTLIALDGTKYLISDYPDFDYLQTGFTNDGVFFWQDILDLDIRLIMQSNINYDGEYNGYVRFSIGDFPSIFNSKLVYNFLQTPKGANLLVADGVGKDKDNFGFTVLDSSIYKIRMNANYNPKPYLNRLITGGFGMENINLVGAVGYTGVNSNLAITEGKYLLKIQPDYMVAKIQKIGGSDNIVISNDVDFNGFKATNLGVPVDGTDSVRLVDLNSNNVLISGTTADSKAIKTLSTKLNEIDTSISNSSSDLTNLQSKITPIFCSSRKLTQINTTNKTLAGQAFYRPIDFCNIVGTGGYENSLSFIKQGTTNSVLKETNMVTGYQRQLVIGISLGHNNTMATKKIECSVFLKRGDGTVVRGGNSMIFYDTQTRLQTSTTMTVTLDIADNFVTQGWYLEIQNLNAAPEILTFSTIDILINVIQLPKLAGV